MSRKLNMTPMSAAHIRELRMRMRYSRKGWAEFLGVGPATVANWECGRVVPKGAGLAALRLLEAGLSSGAFVADPGEYKVGPELWG